MGRSTQGSLTIADLRHQVAALPTLAEWFAREWGDGSPGRSAACYAEQLAAALDARPLPVCLVGLLGAEPVATATLKFREIEYTPEADYWLGWVCVRPDMRRRGFGAALVRAVEAEAAGRRVSPLYLHTPDREAFYLRLGWRTIGMRRVSARSSTVMTKAVIEGL